VKKVKADEMKGAAYEDKEWRIVTYVDRFCDANGCKYFYAESVGHHVACDWRCNLYVKRGYWCSTEIACRYGAAIFRSDVRCAHLFQPDACKFFQEMSTTNTTKDRR